MLEYATVKEYAVQILPPWMGDFDEAVSAKYEAWDDMREPITKLRPLLDMSLREFQQKYGAVNRVRAGPYDTVIQIVDDDQEFYPIEDPIDELLEKLD